MARIRAAFLKPPPTDPGAPAPEPAPPPSAEELEAAVAHADDKERLVGLLGAPIGAAIGYAIINALIANDPRATGKNGQPNKLHVPVSTYHELLVALLGLSLAMLVSAWFRKRFFLGAAMALYGLADFNLHYWGFGLPFLMVGAWLLVRAYRLQRDLKEAGGGQSRRSSAAGPPPRPRPNKRYTPPT